ncbi:MAG: beta-lactamase family protein [Bacteroidia bacterium]|nr:beta-lactamase family protein [Bacteroidia bacterium]
MRFRFSLIFLSAFISCNQQVKQEPEKPQIPLSDIMAAPVTVAFSSKSANAFESYFSDLFSHRHFNGNILMSSGDSLYENSYGFASFDTKDSLNINTSFQLASTSKPFTATATMMLFEKGKINLDSTVNAYIKEFPYRGVTIKMLLSHTSGLPNYMHLTDTLWKDKTIQMCNDDIICFLRDCKPAAAGKPGEFFEYCNTNFAVLAVVIEKASGLPFRDFIKNNIFDKVGMTHTFIVNEDSSAFKYSIATGHNVMLSEKEPHYHDGIYGDKGVYSTVHDLFLFSRALSTGYLIKPATLKMMCEPQVTPKAYGKSYGLGFRMMNMEGKKWIYHNGWWHGFRAYFWNNFEEKKCFIALTNTTRDGYLKEEEIIPMLH